MGTDDFRRDFLYGVLMGQLPFQIKICGVTSAVDAGCALTDGANAIGVNFYSESKRCVSIEQAAALRTGIEVFCRLPMQLRPTLVGVFVNSTPDEIEFTRTNRRFLLGKAPSETPFTGKYRFHNGAPQFDWIQLHGDETPEFVRQVKAQLGLPIMRALRWGREGAGPIDEYLQQCGALGSLPDAVLIDAHKTGEYGGTGETTDWEAIARWRENRTLNIPLVLAGGLTPENIAEAIQIVRPDAVDTASGVESSPGRKDADRVRAFIAEAKRAFAAMS